MSDWKWHGEDAESIVIPSVQAVAVYTNKSGEIVIRQQNPMGDEDAVLVIPRANAKLLAKAITAEAAKPFFSDGD